MKLEKSLMEDNRKWLDHKSNQNTAIQQHNTKLNTINFSARIMEYSPSIPMLTPSYSNLRESPSNIVEQDRTATQNPDSSDQQQYRHPFNQSPQSPYRNENNFPAAITSTQANNNMGTFDPSLNTLIGMMPSDPRRAKKEAIAKEKMQKTGASYLKFYIILTLLDVVITVFFDLINLSTFIISLILVAHLGLMIVNLLNFAFNLAMTDYFKAGKMNLIWKDFAMTIVTGILRALSLLVFYILLIMTTAKRCEKTFCPVSYTDDQIPLNIIYTIHSICKCCRYQKSLYPNICVLVSALYFWGFSYGSIKISDPFYYQGVPFFDD